MEKQTEDAVQRAGQVLQEIQQEKAKILGQAQLEQPAENRGQKGQKQESAVEQNSEKQNKIHAKTEKINKKSWLERLNGKNLALCLAALWVLLVGGGLLAMNGIVKGNYNQLEQRVNQEIVQLQTNNETAITTMAAEVEAMGQQLTTITASMENTGAAITTSSQAGRDEMAKQIATLQKELADLQKSLKILQEKGK